MSLDLQIARLPQTSQEERDRIRTNAARWAASGTQAQKEQAARMLVALDALIQAERQSFYDSIKDHSVADRVVAAFRKNPLTETEAKVVQALLDHPGSTSTALSRACNWGGQRWHLGFGELCKAREAWLWPAVKSVVREASFYSGILADYDPDKGGWTMKPEVAAAFGVLGLVAKGGKFAEE